MINIRKSLGKDSAFFYQDFEVFELFIQEYYPEVEPQFNEEQFKLYFYYGWASGKRRINVTTMNEVENIKDMVETCERNIKYAKIFFIFFLVSMLIVSVLLIVNLLK